MHGPSLVRHVQDFEPACMRFFKTNFSGMYLFLKQRSILYHLEIFIIMAVVHEVYVF